MNKIISRMSIAAKIYTPLIQSLRPLPYQRCWLLGFLIFNLLQTGCSQAPVRETPAQEIILYNWDGDIPPTVLEAFTKETNIKVNYQVYGSQEEAIAKLRSGQAYDVTIIESRFISLLVNEGLLADLDYKNITNFKNISPNFRSLAYDPDNRYSVPYSWGTTGLLVRTDLTPTAITRWSDLWDARYAHKVAIWKGQPRETLALALKSLGYSANSENPAELEAALARLLALKPNLQFLDDFDPVSAAPALASGKITLAVGYAGDFADSLKLGLQTAYVMPQEGAILWGDTFVVPAKAHNKTGAELFINFLLRPEISAEIVNQKHYASANEAALKFIDPEIMKNPAIYPVLSELKNAEIILPLSAAGQKLYDETWQRFLNVSPK